MKLTGRNALITGGTQGFGRRLVETFLDEGAQVVFCARTARDVATAKDELAPRLQPGQRLLGVVCDIAEPPAVEALFAGATALGPLHVVVNNAGVYGPIGPTEDVSSADWERAWRINVSGTFNVCQHAVRAMKPQGGGKIITISGGGATQPMPRFAAYAASKAAVVRLTETLAEELRADRIDVNAVAPGALRTRLTREVLDAGPERAGAAFFAKNQTWMDEGGADPRLGAGLCVYLASSESDGITGKLLSAQWDPWSNLQAFRAELEGDIYTLRRIVPQDRGLNFG